MSDDVLETLLELVLGIAAIELDEVLVLDQHTGAHRRSDDAHLVDALWHFDGRPSPLRAYPSGNVLE